MFERNSNLPRTYTLLARTPDTLQHHALHFNTRTRTLQHAMQLEQCSAGIPMRRETYNIFARAPDTLQQNTVTHCNTLCPGTPCNIVQQPQNTATRCDTRTHTLQHTALHCNTQCSSSNVWEEFQFGAKRIPYLRALLRKIGLSWAWYVAALCCTVLHCVVLQCVAVCCNVLQCVAVCCVAAQCSVLQRVAACCSVLQRVAVCCSMLQCVAACCVAECRRMLQCDGLCCSLLTCVAVSCTRALLRKI